jgi:hypothetical protein
MKKFFGSLMNTSFCFGPISFSRKTIGLLAFSHFKKIVKRDLNHVRDMTMMLTMMFYYTQNNIKDTTLSMNDTPQRKIAA